MSKIKIREEYSKLQKTHSLPTLESLEHDFGLSDIELEKYPLVEIRKKMQDKIEMFAGILANLLEGEATLSNIYESKALDDKKKADFFRTYKKLMKYLRHSSLLSLSYDEDEEAGFIKDFSGEWKDSIKSELKEYLTVLKDSWESDAETTEEILNYLG